MEAVYIYVWDYTNEQWVKLAVTADGEMITVTE